MCPLKNFDIRWYYNIYKLSQKNYLKVFRLQKTTPVDNYGGEGVENGTQPLFFPNGGHFRKNNLDWMKINQKRKIYMVVLIS